MMTKLGVLGAVVLLLSSTAVAAYAAQFDERDESAAATIAVSDSATARDELIETAELSNQAAPPLYLPAPAHQSAFADGDAKDSAFDR